MPPHLCMIITQAVTKRRIKMIVYIYDKRTNEKKESYNDVYRIASNEKEFIVHTPEGKETIQKKGIKLVVYGF